MFRPIFNAITGQTTKEIEQLNRTIKSQAEQITTLKALHPMPEEEWAKLQTLTLHIAEQQKELDKLAMWLRQNKKVEIAAGMHKGFTLGDIVIKYLSHGQTIPVKTGGQIQ